jgi:tetratricopeptide (TPR) repeat protein
MLPGQADPALLVRFEREGQAQARGDGHPHLARIHSAGAEGHVRFLAMELLPGGDLDRRLRAGPLPPQEAASLVRDVAGGVAELHRAGVLHRDIKAANVLFDAQARPKLVDFGLARLADAASLTETGSLLGTPNCMAPEQAVGAKGQVDERTDVYGLGALLYQALTARPPFDRPSTMAVLLAVANEPPAPPSQLSPKIPPGIEAVCLRCLAKSPEERYPSTRALIEDLDRCLGGERPAALTAPRRPSWLAPAAAVAAVGLALAAAAVGLPGAETSDTEKATPAPEAELPLDAPPEPSQDPEELAPPAARPDARTGPASSPEAEGAPVPPPKLRPLVGDLREAERLALQGPRARAQAYRHARLHGREELALGEAIASGPTPDDYLRRAELRFERGLTRAAEADLHAGLALAPEDVRLLYRLGRVRQRSDQFARAVPVFEQAVALHADHADGWHYLASSRLGAEEFAGARTAAERALELFSNPKDRASATRILAEAQLGLEWERRIAEIAPPGDWYMHDVTDEGKLRVKRVALNQIVEDEAARTAAAYLLRARLAARLRDFAAALDDVEEALRRRPMDPEGHLLHSWVLHKLNQGARARESAVRAEAWGGRERFGMELMLLRAALGTVLERQAPYRPLPEDLRQGPLGQGARLHDMGEHPLAEATLTRAIADAGTPRARAAALTWRARTRQALGRVPEALADLRAALAAHQLADPTQRALLRVELGRLRWAQGLAAPGQRRSLPLAQAEALFTEALEEAPQLLDALVDRARVRRDQGRWAAAVADLAAARDVATTQRAAAELDRELRETVDQAAEAGVSVRHPNRD